MAAPGRLIGICLAAVAAAAGLALLAGEAAAAVTKEQAASQVEQTFEVQVLRVQEGEVAGRAVWLVTAMNPGGDSNAAFQVNTVAVDRETGQLVPSFQHQPSGYELPGAPSYDTRVERNPDRARSGTWR